VPAVTLTDGGAALLVLDVHRFTVARDAGYARLARDRGIARELAEYYEQVDQMLPNLRHLIAGCRAHGLPVIFTRLVAGGARAVTRQALTTGLWAPADSEEARFLPDLRPAPGDAVIDKTTTGAFAGTSLDSMLRGKRIHTVIVAGVQANGTVEQSAREAADRGYGVVVVSDACAAETWTIHGFVMTTLVGGLIRTRTTTAVLEMLEGART
jgi:nicotinamidase-related amidase